jgi:hypothetical protein
MRYSGKLGISQQTEKKPGVWEETITEVDVLGQVEQRTEMLATSTSVLPEYTTTTSISVLARPEPHDSIVYATYLGKRWSIATIVTEFPKIRIFIGKEYHGPLPGAAPVTP